MHRESESAEVNETRISVFHIKPSVPVQKHINNRPIPTSLGPWRNQHDISPRVPSVVVGARRLLAILAIGILSRATEQVGDSTTLTGGEVGMYQNVGLSKDEGGVGKEEFTLRMRECRSSMAGEHFLEKKNCISPTKPDACNSLAN